MNIFAGVYCRTEKIDVPLVNIRSPKSKVAQLQSHENASQRSGDRRSLSCLQKEIDKEPVPTTTTGFAWTSSTSKRICNYFLIYYHQYKNSALSEEAKAERGIRERSLTVTLANVS